MCSQRSEITVPLFDLMRVLNVLLDVRIYLRIDCLIPYAQVIEHTGSEVLGNPIRGLRDLQEQ